MESAHMVKDVKETKMVAPGMNKTQMTDDKMVRVVALREFKIGKFEKNEETGQFEDHGTIVKPGEMVSVTKAKAKELLKKIEGSYAFSGERFVADGGADKHDMSLARLATKSDITPESDKPLDSLD
jgi:hypothetical protein